MNKLEKFPKVIERDGKLYSLDVHITAWNKLCVSYKTMFKNSTFEETYIFSQVVEPEMTKKVREPEVFNDIIDVPTYSKALSVLNKRIDNALKTEEITIYHK